MLAHHFVVWGLDSEAPLSSSTLQARVFFDGAWEFSRGGDCRCGGWGRSTLRGLTNLEPHYSCDLHLSAETRCGSSQDSRVTRTLISLDYVAVQYLLLWVRCLSLELLYGSRLFAAYSSLVWLLLILRPRQRSCSHLSGSSDKSTDLLYPIFDYQFQASDTAEVSATSDGIVACHHEPRGCSCCVHLRPLQSWEYASFHRLWVDVAWQDRARFLNSTRTTGRDAMDHSEAHLGRQLSCSPDLPSHPPSSCTTLGSMR